MLRRVAHVVIVAVTFAVALVVAVAGDW